MESPGVETLGLGQCVLAALWQTRSAILAELVSRLEDAGGKISANVLSLALVDLQTRIDADASPPFALVETGTR